MSLVEALKQVSPNEVDRLVDAYAARLSVVFGHENFEELLQSVLADRRITKPQLATIAALMNRSIVRGTKAEMADDLIRQHRISFDLRTGAAEHQLAA